MSNARRGCIASDPIEDTERDCQEEPDAEIQGLHRLRSD